MILGAIVALIAAGSLTALYALRVAVATSSALASGQLARMQEAQDLVQRTLLVERQLILTMDAASPEELRQRSAGMNAALDSLDGLVDRLGAESDDVEILAIHGAAQLFRNGFHVLAALRGETIAAVSGPRSETPVRGPLGELERETVGMVASAQRLSDRFNAQYRAAVERLARESRAMERWVMAFLAGDVVLAWLAFRYLLITQVVDRLQEVSRYLRADVAGGQDLHVPVQGSDEIAEMARAVEQLLADRRRLDEANRELEDLSYSVSHDLRAPIRHVVGFAQLLAERAGGSLDERGRHYLESISEAGKLMGAQIEGLLAFLRLRYSRMVLSLVELEGLVQELAAELTAQDERRVIEWRIGPLPAITCDRAMLRLALGALLSNAVKFTRPRARAEIEVRASSPAGGELVILVRDNGVGFDARYADKLFRIFHRLHHSEEYAGTGTSLAIVRRVIERHGGRTWAEGVVGEGATFYLSLPHAHQ